MGAGFWDAACGKLDARNLVWNCRSVVLSSTLWLKVPLFEDYCSAVSEGEQALPGDNTPSFETSTAVLVQNDFSQSWNEHNSRRDLTIDPQN